MRSQEIDPKKDPGKTGPEGRIPPEQLNQELEPGSSSREETDPKKREYLKMLKATENELKVRIRKNIVFSTPILTWDDIPMLMPYTINLIQGQAGSHKSRLAELICAILLAKAGTRMPIPSIIRTWEKPLVVLYVDTERNLREQLPFSLQTIRRKAGYNDEEALDNFRFTSLLQFSREERFEALETLLDEIRASSEAHIVIVLDVITDCVSDFNRTDASLKLMDLMNQYINTYNVTFLCVIHENPGMGQGKARGHLGTEGMNKASTVMQIRYEKDSNGVETDILRLKFLKCRMSGKPPIQYLRYDSIEKGLVMADTRTVSEMVDGRRQGAHIEDVIEQLETQLSDGPKMRKELMKELTAHFEVSEKTLIHRIRGIIEDQTELRNLKGETCHLHCQKIGRNHQYLLSPVLPKKQ